jgi:LmbE family N-acetylglucosaminyl deacetylase
VKADFERLKDALQPDLVFTHARSDAHQDHRCVCELTWNTFRHHLVLEYEVPKWDGDLGQPNVYVPLPEDLATRKASLLLEHYRSQRGRQWFAEEVFLSLMRLRGMECRSPSGYAEAFFGRKLCLRS